MDVALEARDPAAHAAREAKDVIAAILSHPLMPEARRLYLRQFLDLYGGNRS